MKIIDLNWLDWMLVAATLFSTVMAFKRGLVRAVLGMAGYAAGFALASQSYAEFADWMLGHRISLPLTAARSLAFLLIVLGTAAGFELFGWRLQRVLHGVGLSGLDRILGLGFGFARGCLIGIALLIAITAYAPGSEAVAGSVLSPYLFAVAHDVSFLVPQYLQGLMMYGASNFNGGASH